MTEELSILVTLQKKNLGIAEKIVTVAILVFIETEETLFMRSRDVRKVVLYRRV